LFIILSSIIKGNQRDASDCHKGKGEHKVQPRGRIMSDEKRGDYPTRSKQGKHKSSAKEGVEE
jgi:hypothetical protein